MKITSVDVHVVSFPVAKDHMPGYEVSWTFVTIGTDEGLVGLGECTNWPHGSDLIVAQALRTIGKTLIGRDPMQIDRIWNDIYRRYTYLGSRGVITMALSGIDIALWDLKGKALGVPVYELFGGALRDEVPVYIHPGGMDGPSCAENAVALMEEGHRAFKWDPFGAEMVPRHTNYIGGMISRGGVRTGAEVIETVRTAVGPDAEILIDFHGQYNVATAVEAIRALQPYDITWFEEPLPPEGTRALRQIRDQVDAPLCVGERLHTRFDFVPIFEDRLANYVMPDPCWTGGLSELKKIAVMAEAHFVPIAPHGAAGPLQVFASGHVMKTVPNLYRLEILGPTAIAKYNEFLSEPITIRNGEFIVPEGPGLGIDLDWDRVRAHPHPDLA